METDARVPHEEITGYPGKRTTSVKFFTEKKIQEDLVHSISAKHT